jgi:hypothetical protein
MTNGNSRTMAKELTEGIEVEVLRFDLDALGKIKAREMSRLMRMNDLDEVAAICAKYVTACPSSWGDPKSPDTYLDLPFRGETGSLQAVISAMAEAIKNAS